MDKYLGFALILIAAFSWGFIGVLARFLLENGMGPVELVFWRAAFACAAFSIVALAKKQARLHSRKDFFSLMLFGSVCLGSVFISYMTAVKLGGAALTVVLQYTAPAWVAILARLLFQEPLTKAKVAAVFTSLTGVALVSLSGSAEASHISTLSVGLGLLSGFLFAIQSVSVKKLVATYSPFTIFSYGFFFASLTLFPFADFVEKSTADWGILLLLGMGCTVLPFFCYAAGVKRIEASTASIIATLEPVVGTIAAWLIWNETFSGLGVVGIALVIGAVVMLVANAATAVAAAGKRPSKSTV